MINKSYKAPPPGANIQIHWFPTNVLKSVWQSSSELVEYANRSVSFQYQRDSLSRTVARKGGTVAKPCPAWMLSCFSCVRLFVITWTSPPGFSVHEILQARILESVAIPFSRGSFQPRDCRGPAPADPGYSKRGRRRRPIYLFIKDLKSNRMRIAQWGNSVEKSGWNKDSSVGKFSGEKRLK